ncbi:MAG: ATP synthase subunit I [Gammaproteobacteria bacterium]|nr:ATP synthase subunit I [Gammaproteobacteria bacterium]
MFESMRKSAMRLVLIQAAAGSLAGAFAGLMFGSAAGVAAFSGAGIGLVGSLFMVAGLLRVRAGATPGQMLARVLAGEAVKWAVTAAGFVVCIVTFDMHFLALLGGFVATLLGYWAGLLPAVLGEAGRAPVPSAR